MAGRFGDSLKPAPSPQHFSPSFSSRNVSGTCCAPMNRTGPCTTVNGPCAFRTHGRTLCPSPGIASAPTPAKLRRQYQQSVGNRWIQRCAPALRGAHNFGPLVLSLRMRANRSVRSGLSTTDSGCPLTHLVRSRCPTALTRTTYPHPCSPRPEEADGSTLPAARCYRKRARLHRDLPGTAHILRVPGSSHRYGLLEELWCRLTRLGPGASASARRPRCACDRTACFRTLRGIHDPASSGFAIYRRGRRVTA